MVLCLLRPASGQDRDVQTENVIIRFYQDYISGADGSRCPMTPSCSRYAAQAIGKHGPVIGWVMTCDRIIRCGRSDTRLAPRIRTGDQEAIDDPVSFNDFWWFTAPEKDQ